MPMGEDAMKPPKTIWFRMRRRRPPRTHIGVWHYVEITGTHKNAMRREAKDVLCESHGRTGARPWGGPFEFEECQPDRTALFKIGAFLGADVFAEQL